MKPASMHCQLFADFDAECDLQKHVPKGILGLWACRENIPLHQLCYGLRELVPAKGTILISEACQRIEHLRLQRWAFRHHHVNEWCHIDCDWSRKSEAFLQTCRKRDRRETRSRRFAFSDGKFRSDLGTHFRVFAEE